MRPSSKILALRNGTAARDRAILDLLQLQALGRVPGSISTAELRLLWHTSQSQISRRMTAVHQLGAYVVRSGWGRYTFLSGHELRAARWEARRQQLKRVLGI